MLFKKKGLFEGLHPSIHPATGLEVPVRYYMAEMVMSYFEADFETVRAWVPSASLHPIRINSKTGILCIITTQCKHSSIGEFSAVALSVPVTTGKKPAPAKMPLIFEESWPNKGLFLYKEATTTSEAYRAATELWSHPEFLAEIKHKPFDENNYEVTVLEEQRILSLKIKQPSYVREERSDIKVFSEKQTLIFESTWQIHANVSRSRKPEDTMVFWGNHPIGSQLKTLKVGPLSFETRYYMDLNLLKPLSDKILS